MRSNEFQRLILNWFDQYGRKNLPWQYDKTPYRIWISEIMLQQTQVNTVIPYYERFMQQYPDLQSLANADEEQILHLWSGLGYYSRARNLYQASRLIMQNFTGVIPNNIKDLTSLPGIGQSTAGAILAIAFNQPAPILDGNVKRVLTRFHGISEPINQKVIENQLWNLATQYTPTERVADYTQAMMDLGATLCIRGKPKCEKCPLHIKCTGYAQGIAPLLPIKQSPRFLPIKTATFLILQQNSNILLCKRPAIGIWGGLWGFPEIPGEPDLKLIKDYCLKQFQISIDDYQQKTAFRHSFSHYHLEIHPFLIQVRKIPHKIMEADKQIWYNLEQPKAIGLPKPVQFILRGLS